jgi:anion-transporting  ArsA/GET3 family ATPase
MIKMATMAMAQQNPGMQGANLDEAFDKINAYKVYAEKANLMFRDHDKTTFVAVCIPEFLSL